jgi:hypothetical protein
MKIIATITTNGKMINVLKILLILHSDSIYQTETLQRPQKKG